MNMIKVIAIQKFKKTPVLSDLGFLVKQASFFESLEKGGTWKLIVSK